ASQCRSSGSVAWDDRNRLPAQAEVPLSLFLATFGDLNRGHCRWACAKPAGHIIHHSGDFCIRIASAERGHIHVDWLRLVTGPVKDDLGQIDSCWIIDRAIADERGIRGLDPGAVPVVATRTGAFEHAKPEIFVVARTDLQSSCGWPLLRDGKIGFVVNG